MNDYVKNLLVSKLTDVTVDIESCDQMRIDLEEQMSICNTRYQKNLDKKADLIEKLKLIDPEGTYE